MWQELIDLGSAVYNEPLYSEALAVCREIIRRASVNIRTLHGRLTALGYEFASTAALVEAGPDAETEICAFEAEFGELPLIARIWYRAFRSVDFTQAERQRYYFSPKEQRPIASDVQGLGRLSVLQFQSLAAGRAQWYEWRAEAEKQFRDAQAGGHFRDESFEFDRFLPLGGYASNCDSIGFRLPACSVDAVVYNSGGGDVYFVPYLREALRSGGFPVSNYLLDPNYWLTCEYQPNLAILPALREGMLEL